MAAVAPTREEVRRRVLPVNGRVVRIGLIAGAASVYLMAVGMVEKFDERAVIANVVNLGRVLLIITAMVFGWVAARSRANEGQPRGVGRLVAGGVAGLVAGLVSGLALLVVNAIGPLQVRRMFQSVNPNLVNEVLSFGRGVGFGFVVLVVAGLAFGALGAGLQQIPTRFRRATMTGLGTLIVVSLAQPFVVQVFQTVSSRIGTDISSRWLYPRGGGLTILGVILTFGGGFAYAWWRTIRKADARGARPRTALGAAREGGGVAEFLRARGLRIAGTVVLLALLVLLPWIVGPFLSQVLNTVGIFVLLGLGLNIVVGFAGLLDLGYVAFFAVGAYATAVLTSPASFLANGGDGLLDFWVALPVVLVLALVSGLMIGAPVLRLRGDYLAIVTLGFGEIARVIVASPALQDFLGGPQGILRIPSPPVGGVDLRAPQNLYYVILAFSLIAAFVSFRLKDSRVGRAWAAMREDETVAEAMGISIINYKLLAFAIGAGVGCLGGAFFAIQVGSVFPNSFDILVSINALSVIVLGGMGSIPGVVVGSLALVGLPELLREFEEFRLLIYGAVLVALMILKPEGLLPEVRRRRELHEEEAEEEQFERRAGEGPEPVLRAEAAEDEETP